MFSQDESSWTMVSELSPCGVCGRMFSAVSLNKHFQHCSKPQKQLKFNARHHYLSDTPSEGFLRSTRITKSKLGRSKLRMRALPLSASLVAPLRRTSVSSLTSRAKLPSASPAICTPTASMRSSRGIDILEFLEIVPKDEPALIGLHPLEQPRPKTADRKFVVPQFSSPKKSPEKKLNRYDRAAEAVNAKAETRETMLFSRRP